MRSVGLAFARMSCWVCPDAKSLLRCGVRPRPAGWDGTPHVSSAPTQGHPSPGRSALSSLRIGERPCDNPEGASGKHGVPPRVA